MRFFSPKNLIEYLDQGASQTPTTTETMVRGYKVTVARQALSTTDIAERRSAVAQIIARSLARGDETMKGVIGGINKVKHFSGIAMAICWGVLLLTYLLASILGYFALVTQRAYHGLYELPTGVAGGAFNISFLFGMLMLYPLDDKSGKKFIDKLFITAAKTLAWIVGIGVALTLTAEILKLFSDFIFELERWYKLEILPIGKTISSAITAMWFALMITYFVLLVRQKDTENALKIGGAILLESISEIAEFFWEHRPFIHKDHDV
ncbi:MAG: hypothetical protein HY306_01985 [Nitrosomonadales bacterium]|nr:hypothetical protein [Nitrosomonadales bacterium]